MFLEQTAFCVKYVTAVSLLTLECVNSNKTDEQNVGLGKFCSIFIMPFASVFLGQTNANKAGHSPKEVYQVQLSITRKSTMKY